MTSGVPGWPVAFRGSTARAAGLVTSAQLRGPRYRRIFPDVYSQVEAAEVTITRGGIRGRPGLRLHRDRLLRDEIELRHGLWLTTPRCTAFDLARWAPDRVERVVALDALANAGHPGGSPRRCGTR